MPSYEFITKESFLDYWLTTKDSGYTYHEDSVFQSIHNAVDAVIEADLWEPAIVLINIEHYKGQLPKNFERAIQILWRDLPQGKHKRGHLACKRTQVVEWTRDLFGSHGCQLRTSLECPKCHEIDCECKTSIIPLASAEAEFRFPELVANLSRASRVISTNPESPFYNHYHKCDSQWRWIRPASNHFFNHTEHIGDCVNFGIETETEYKIQKPFIQVNEMYGQILMSALVSRADSDGYRLIPNTPIVLRLLTAWIETDRAQNLYLRYMTPEYERLWRNMETQRLALLRTARAEINVSDPDEQEVFMQNFWRKWVNPTDYQHNLGRLTPEKYQFRND